MKNDIEPRPFFFAQFTTRIRRPRQKKQNKSKFGENIQTGIFNYTGVLIHQGKLITSPNTVWFNSGIFLVYNIVRN